ncbi:MAG: glycosyl hydrolase family 18 protein [Verrucomicrobia bacterium]|nr:glycosyl hydrolase family 18 protein [Verrucomicrobiota bacterium]
MTPRAGRWMKSAVVAALLGLLAVATARAERRVVAYVPNWVDLETFAKTIDYAALTHINLAFENPTNAEGDLSYHAKNDALVREARAHNVKILLSIGGGAAADSPTLKPRYFELLTEQKRAGFVAKLTEYLVKHNYDGLDVDLEGPSINQDYGAFIRDLAAALKPKGKLLTAALSRGYGGGKVPDEALGRFDFINIMAYDGAGTWAPNRPGQHSSMEYARTNVDYWLQRGLAKDKAVLGVPFYGYGFGKAFRKSSYAYRDILQAHPGAEKVDEIGETIWYNGQPTMREKVRYAVEQGLGGIMIWSLDNDVKDGRSLLGTITEAMKEGAKR